MSLRFKLSPQSRSTLRTVRRWLRSAWELIRTTWSVTREAQLPLIAGSLTYTTLLSIVPLLALSFAIFKAFGGLDKLYETVEPILANILAQGVSDQVIRTLHGFVENVHANAVGLGGLIGLILTTMSMLSSAEKAINLVWRTENQRNIFQRVSSYWLLVTLGPIFASFAIGFATSNDFPLSSVFPSGSGMFALTIAAFFFTYKWVPNAPVSPLAAAISALLTAIAFNLARMLYGLYIAKAIGANQFYGSLGALPVLMVWIHLLWTIILSGAALTVALQRRFK